MVKIVQRIGEIPVFPDNEEMFFEFSPKRDWPPVVLKFISHYYWEDGSDHPATLSIFFNVEAAEKLFNELRAAIYQARTEITDKEALEALRS